MRVKKFRKTILGVLCAVAIVIGAAMGYNKVIGGTLLVLMIVSLPASLRYGFSSGGGGHSGTGGGAGIGDARAWERYTHHPGMPEQQPPIDEGNDGQFWGYKSLGTDI